MSRKEMMRNATAINGVFLIVCETGSVGLRNDEGAIYETR
jgi:hypothetical protein